MNFVQQLTFSAPKPHSASTLSASASAIYSLAGWSGNVFNCYAVALHAETRRKPLRQAE